MTPKNWMEERLKDLPKDITAIVFLGSGSWICGSVADPSKVGPFKDYDIIVPHREWTSVSQLLAINMKFIRFTRYGGISGTIDGDHIIDVWPDDIDKLMLLPLPMHLWHPKSMTLWSRNLL